MTQKIAVVVTSIPAPNRSLRAVADGVLAHRYSFLVIGHTKSPAEFQLDGCDFYDVERQRSPGLRCAELCPTHSYTRKNIGYLLAIRSGAPLIIKTDDDNIPRQEFWSEQCSRSKRPRSMRAVGERL